jgi:ATP-dependent Clp protease protease subunit
MAAPRANAFILPNAKVMIHQPFGGVYGQAADIEIQAEEISRPRTLVNVMARCTGQPPTRSGRQRTRPFFRRQKRSITASVDE